MSNTNGFPRGFGQDSTERLPLPERTSMNNAQRAAADALIQGPRKGVKGPFIPLLRSPALLERMAKVGESLRFESVLPTRVNEFATLVVARHTSNQFEWAVHHPLALAAGTERATLDALAAGTRPPALSAEEALVYDFANEVLTRHGVADSTYQRALDSWGEQGVVELTALIGYFASVCWVMNVARTPAPAHSDVPPLTGFPG